MSAQSGYDPICEDIAHHFLDDIGRTDLTAKLAQHIQTQIEDWIASETELPEPCTSDAVFCGCTCRMESVNSASIDPPEPIVDPWCPLHGNRDPDREYDEMRDRRDQP